MKKSHFSNQPIYSFVSEHNLTQLIHSPTQQNVTLDFVFVSQNFSDNHVENVAPIAGSDYCAQLCFLNDLLQRKNQPQTRQKINFDNINSILNTIHWTSVFSGCQNVDDYAEVFQAQLNSAIALSSFHINLYWHERLLRHIVQLIHTKQRH